MGMKLYWLNDNIFVYATLKVHETESNKLLADKIRELVFFPDYARSIGSDVAMPVDIGGLSGSCEYLPSAVL
jgi:hypothetical protein